MVSFQSIRTTTKTKLNLVPEYIDSDDSDDENLETTEKPLFPLSNSYQTNSQSVKNIELETETSSQSDNHTLNSPKREEKKQKPSFASIITGGRSPQHETVDIKIYGEDDQNADEAASKISNDCNETEILPQKTFQRKRRIEFNVRSTQAKRQHQNEDIHPDAEPLEEVSNSMATLKNKYSNFQKGGTEFLDKQSSNEVNDTEAETVAAGVNQVRDEQKFLEEKLNFLCQGRADVSPVQIIQIQLQVR